jgi:signal transduction histidine kinase
MRIDRRVRLVPVALLFLLLTVFAVVTQPNNGAGRPGASYRLLAGRVGPVIEFVKADFAFSGARTLPAAGWRRGAVPNFKLLQVATRRQVDPPTVWVRFRFDRTALGAQPTALYVEMVRDDFILYLNGAELYRSRGDAADPSFGWNHPLFVPLPAAMLRAGGNELAFRIDTTSPQLLGIGSIRVGADQDVRSTFNNQYFLSNIAPQIVSGYLLILTVAAISFWIKRPAERVYGWLALVGVTWLFRNLHYSIQEPPFNPALFWIMTTDSLFVLMAVVFGFATSYFRLPHPRRIYLALFVCGAIGIATRHLLVNGGHSELPSFMLSFPICVILLAILFRTCQRSPTPQNWSMFAAIVAAVICTFHDMLFSFNISRGASFFLQPYGGLLIFAAFDAALTSRLQNALIDVEDVNLKLEARVARVTEDLVRSEVERAELQIAHAVNGERERMMREIHDGIGSSLLTALAAAKHRNDSPDTIATLTRSLTDLRIGVDSLEPIGGDVVALLANLRHRMERELKGAGLAFVWKVRAAPPLIWLDPVGALHILRILQEAIGNALLHSEADHVEVRCAPADHGGIGGVLIEIADTGKGFDPASPSRGKGLTNMAARAEALNAKFWCESKVGAGTIASIWLPLEQAGPGGPSPDSLAVAIQSRTDEKAGANGTPARAAKGRAPSRDP